MRCTLCRPCSPELTRGQCDVFKPTEKRYHLKQIVMCPETDQAAGMSLGAYPGSLSPAKRQPSIRSCSLWAEAERLHASLSRPGNQAVSVV